MIVAALFLLAQPQDSAFSAVLAKLGATEGVTFTYVDLTVSGESRSWVVKVRKPNLVTAESESYSIFADGKSIVVFDKGAHRFTSHKQTGESLARLLERTELLPARLFLDPKGGWLKSVRPAGKRNRRGVELTGALLTLKEGQTATVYSGTSDKAINYIQIETVKAGNKETRLLDRFKVESQEHKVSAFVFRPSGRDWLVDGFDDAKTGQDERANELTEDGYIAYRQLTWDDYRVIAAGVGRSKVFTMAFIKASYEWSSSRSGRGWRVTLTSVDVRSGLDKNRSWRQPGVSKATLERLLPHEQGHLDINEVEARKLRRKKISVWPSGNGATQSAAVSDAEAKFRTIVDDAIAKAAAQHELYDKETRHGVNADSQRLWETKIATQMSGRT